ncbi:MAG TPA: nicotinate-nucleotide--dimethylbenzimidazole phosphoribosyltransferase, partial [Actinomycetes bacterium]|nr:nicotinate-nucleotide--dimethylbenzimidazole phosphoribosyltransferase [Actinomycetes bacterium]
GQRPLLDLGMRLGEGSGALAAVPLLRLAAAAVAEVATFAEWGLHDGPAGSGSGASPGDGAEEPR